MSSETEFFRWNSLDGIFLFSTECFHLGESPQQFISSSQKEFKLFLYNMVTYEGCDGEMM